jgi:hypothetical protein
LNVTFRASLGASQLEEANTMLMDHATEVTRQLVACEASTRDFIVAEVWAMTEIQAKSYVEAVDKDATHRVLVENCHQQRLAYKVARRK